MPNVNIFHGVGHLGQDPDVKTLSNSNSTVVANFSAGIASNEKINGEWAKTTEWIRGVVFGKQAEWLRDAQKGDLVIFTGRLKTEKYTDKDGIERYATKIICSDCQTFSKSRSDKPRNESYGATTGGIDDNSDTPF